MQQYLMLTRTQHVVLSNDLADLIAEEAKIDGRSVSGYLRAILLTLSSSKHEHGTLLAVARACKEKKQKDKKEKRKQCQG